MRRLRRQCASLAWLLLALGASAADAANTTAKNCPLSGQLLAGDRACGRQCPIENTVACLPLSKAIDICKEESPSFTKAHVSNSCQNDTCDYQCFLSTHGTIGDTFVFYVSPNSSDYEWDEDTIHQSVRVVRSISEMDLQPRFRNLSIIGGLPTSDSSSPIGVLVNLTLTSANITSLSLRNLDMRDVTKPTVRINQTTNATLQSLSITNCLLDSLPFDTKKLSALTSLDLSQNNIAEYPRQQSIQSLTHLSLRENKLTSFLAAFPSLKSLDLAKNRLTGIPDTVYLSKNLTSLDLSGNPLVSSTFTAERYAFLSNLTDLIIDDFAEPASSASCSNLRLLRTLPVCVSDEQPYYAVAKSKLWLYITGPVGGTAVVMLAVFSLWYYRRKKRYWQTQADGDGTPVAHTPSDASKAAAGFAMLGDGSSGHTMNSTDDDEASYTQVISSTSLWADEVLLASQVRFDDIEDLHAIGSGAFAVVWLVRYRQSRLLASKRLVKDQVAASQRRRTQEFVAEIKLVAQLDHPSIVQFVGVAWTVASNLQALFEYMPGGDLLAYLSSIPPSDERRYWTASKVQLAIDVVEALVYVHSFTPALLHRDLKSKNILLSEEKKAKLTDFGVSRYQSENGTMTAGVGTGKWLAPEVLLGGSSYDHRSDIYSFGVVLCELDTHTLPYAELQVSDVAVLQMVVGGTARPRLSDGCPLVLRDLVDRCLSYESERRPSAMEIAYVLRTFAKTLEVE